MSICPEHRKSQKPLYARSIGSFLWVLIGTLVVFGVQVIPLNIRLSFENKPGLFMYWKQVKSVIPDYKNSKEGLKHHRTTLLI